MESAKAKPPPRHRRGAARRQEASVVPASYSTDTTVPLGVRYSILRREGAESVEASPDAVFRSGDRIRLRVEVNGSGYLYIIHRGSSGVLEAAVPLRGDQRAATTVWRRGKTYEIPSGYVFTFDEQPGEEKLFIVLSRQPEADLERLIYSLERQPKGRHAPPSRRRASFCSPRTW